MWQSRIEIEYSVVRFDYYCHVQSTIAERLLRAELIHTHTFYRWIRYCLFYMHHYLGLPNVVH